MSPAEDRDYFSELNALDDAPAPQDEAPVGVSETARALDGDITSLVQQQAQERETERGKGIFGSFYDAIGGAVQSFRDDPKLKEMLTAPVRAAYDVSQTPVGQTLLEGSKAGFRGTVNTAGSFATGVEQFARSGGFTGLGDAADKTADGLKDIAQSKLLKARVEGLSKIKSESWFKDTLDYALSATGEGLGSSVPFLAIGASPAGLPGVAAFGYTTSLGELRDELKESGVTDEPTIAKYSYLAAVPHAILDQMTERGLISSLTGEAKKALRKNLLRSVMTGATKEGLTEATQRVIELGTVAHALGGEAPTAAAIDAVFSDLNKGLESSILESGVRGALPGSVFGAVESLGDVTGEPTPAGTPTTDPLSRVIELDALDTQEAPTSPAETQVVAATPATPVPTPTSPVPAVGQETGVRDIAASEVPKGKRGNSDGMTQAVSNLDFIRVPQDGGGLVYEARAGEKVVAKFRIRNNEDGTASVNEAFVEPDYRRIGVATAAYEKIQQDIDANELRAEPVDVVPRRLVPDKSLSPEAVEFWRKRDPESLADHMFYDDGSAMRWAASPSDITGLPTVAELASTPEGQAVVQAVESNPELNAASDEIASVLAPADENLSGPVIPDVPGFTRQMVEHVRGMADPRGGVTLTNKQMARQLALTFDDEFTERDVHRVVEALKKVGKSDPSSIWYRPEAAVNESTATEQPAAPDLTAKFREVIASNAKVLDWPKLVGATPEQMNDLVDQAVVDGVLNRTKGGALRKVKLVQATAEPVATDGSVTPPLAQAGQKADRTSASPERSGGLKQQTSSLSIPSDVRIDRAIQTRETQTGKPVPTVVADYALRIEQARGTEQFQSIIDEIKSDKLMRKGDVHDLAHLVGYPVSKSTTKQDALETVVIRNNQFVEGRNRIEFTKGWTAASIASIARNDAADASTDVVAGQSAKRTLDSLGFYSQALEAAKALKQNKGTPEQMRAQLRSSGVKEAEIQAVGLDAFLDGKKSVTKADIVQHLEERKVDVSEVRYPYSSAKDQARVARIQALEAEQRQLLEQQNTVLGRFNPSISRRLDENNNELFELKNAPGREAGNTKWSSYSLDSSNPTYRETVLHLPRTEPERKYDAAIIERAKKYLRDNGFNPEEDWGYVNEATYVDAAVGQGMPQPTGEAGISPAFQSGHWPEPNVIAHARTSIQKDVSGKPVFVINELQSDWGQKLRDGGVRDETKIAGLKAAHATAIAETDALWGPAQAALRAVDNLGFASSSQAATAVRTHEDWQTRWDVSDAEAGPIRAYADAAAKSRLLRAEVGTAEASTPGNPLVNNTDAWVNVGLKRMIRQAVEAGADQIAIPSGDTVISFGMGGEAAGLKYAYDQMYPKNLRNLLQKIDKSVEGKKIENLYGLEGETLQRSKGFTTFHLTDKVKQQVKGEGFALFSLGSIGRPTPPLTPEFEESIPEFVDRLTAELRRMLPNNVAIRIVDRLIKPDGAEDRGLYNAFTNVLYLAHSPFGRFSPLEAAQVGKHEVIHALRLGGLFDANEWDLLVNHAKQTGVKETITALDENDNEVQAWDAYREIYMDQALRFGAPDPEAMVNEYMDQELVAKMAETWAVGKQKFPSKIAALFDRIVKFFDAVRKTLYDLGFLSNNPDADTADRVFQRAFSGEVADRSRTVTLPDGTNVEGTNLFSLKAFHGTPHTFDKFDSSKIGTGEGAQAYGHGLYFAEREGVARSYRDRLSGRTGIESMKIDGADVKLDTESKQWLGGMLYEDSKNLRDATDGNGVFSGDALDHWKDVLKKDLTQATDPDGRKLTPKDRADTRDTIAFLDSLYGKRIEFPDMGRLYEVRINADAWQFLDWDKPLAQQPETVRKAIESHPAFVEPLSSAPDNFMRNAVRDAETAASLREAGIVGIRYLDAVSRGAGDGTANIVVFPGNEHLVEIVAVDGKPVNAGMELASIARLSSKRSIGIPAAATSVSTFTKDSEIKSDPDYKAAKAGDPEAAARMVERLVTKADVEKARQSFGSDAIYVPVVAEEATGKNKIPEMLAHFYAISTGAQVSDDIVQASRAYHTGARPLERLLSRPIFDGEVQPGKNYVLVDDVSVMGGTLAELANHIQSNGGLVSGIVTLVNASRTGQNTANGKDISDIDGRFGDVLRSEFGLEPSALTGDEAFYLRGFRDADSLRNSIAKARRERNDRLRAKGLRASEGQDSGLTLASIASLSKTPNLDMSPDARKARAEAQGFDTSVVWYHGSPFGDREAFDVRPARRSNNGFAGISLTKSTKAASTYAGFLEFNMDVPNAKQSLAARLGLKEKTTTRQQVMQPSQQVTDNSVIIPLYARVRNPFKWNIPDFRDGGSGDTQRRLKEAAPSFDLGDVGGGYLMGEHADLIEALSAAGYDALDFTYAGDGIVERVVFDTANVRSVNAAFDPAQEASPLLLASVARFGPYRPVSMGQSPTQDISAPEQRLSDIVKSVTKALGLTVRKGRIDPGLKRSAAARGNDVAGQFSAITGVTRLALPNDLATLSHEGGHALEVRPSIKDDLGTLKADHAEELATPAAPNGPAPALVPGQGFSGLEIDADTLDIAKRATEADTAWRTLTAQVAAAKAGGGLVKAGSYDQAAYTAAQEEAAVSRAALIRRLGRQTADAVIADATKANPADLGTYLATRFSATGTPQSRAIANVTPVELSEGFAEWFRIYVTNPSEARAVAPEFYPAFESMLEDAEPDLLDSLREIQDQVQALAKASPTGAVRSRIQSTVTPGMFKAMREAVDERGLANTIGDQVYKFYHAFFDARHPMKRAVKFLLKTAQENLGIDLQGKDKLLLKAIDDPYKLWRLAEHSKVHATAALQNGITNTKAGEVDPSGPSYWDALVTAFGGKSRSAWSDENAELFGSYLTARRMLAEFGRYDRGELENLPDQVISRDIWQKAKDQLEQQFPDFAAGANLLYGFNKKALKLKLDNGFLSQETYDDLINRVDYVPLNRIMDDGSPSMLGKTARGNNKRRLIYKFQGSTRDFINPLESIAQDMYATQARIALNDTIRAMDRLARAAGPGGGAIAERLPASEMKGTTMDLRDAIKAAARSQNIAQADKEGLLDIIDDLFDQDAAATIFRATEVNEKGEPIVYLWEDGKKVPIRVGDNRIAQDIFQGFVGMGQANSNILVDVAALGTQALRAGITKAPAYILTNFLRDQIATWILSEHFTPFATGTKGLVSVAKNDATAKRYAAFAGLMGGVDANLIDTAANKRDVLTLRRKGFSAVPAKSGIGQVWQTVLRSMEVTEAGTRFGHFEAAYQRALKDGLAPVEAAYEAAYAAHDVMDFSRRGSKMTEIARIVAFLNASLQGLDVARRTMTGERDTHTNFREVVTPYLKAATGSPLTLAEKKALPNSSRFWMKAVTVGMAGVALAALYRDDPEYEEFSDQMRATHWFFKINGIWFRYPKPFELAFFSNLFEAGFEKLWKGNDRARKQFTESIKNTMIPPHEINIVKSYYEWQTGVDMFRGTKIVSSDIGALPPEMQFTAYTSELGKLIGNITGLAPVQVDQVMGGLFGTVGRDLMGASDIVLPGINRATGGALPGVATETRAEKSPEDYWIASRFTRRASRGSLSSKQFWDEMAQDGGKFTSAAAGYKNLKRAGDNRGARDLVDYLGDEEKAYAYLEGEFKEDDQDLHPLNRARQVMAAASGIRKEMVLGHLYKQGSVPDANHKYREPEQIIIPPAKQKIVNEILEDLAMREARNALIVIQEPGWTQKSIMPTEDLLTELRASVPEVADEFEIRLTKGRNKVYPFEGVRKAWPEAKSRLLKEGGDANLSDLRAEAANP
jgi:hypothetical protein